MSTTTQVLNAFTCQFDITSQRLRGKWLGSVAELPLRAHYADLLHTAQMHGNCCCWLLDLRGRNWHTPGFGRWFSEVFAPAAHMALHQPLFIACVLSAEHRALANTPGTRTMQRGCATHDVYPFFFDNEAAAHEWLAHQQAFDE